MKLTEQDRRILGAVELDADKPMQRIRAETGYRDHTIRYHLDRLITRKIITRRPFINPYPLGLVEYGIYFSVAADEKVSTEKFLNELVASSEVSWIVSLGGDYQYGIAVCANHHTRVIEFIDRISERFPNIFFAKALSIRNSLTLFPRKAFGPHKMRMSPLTFGGKTTSITLDDKDIQILAGLETFSYGSQRDLARQLNIPIATFVHRVQRMQEEGIIVGYLYRINMAMFGYQIYRILIYASGVNSTFRKELYQFADQHPDVNYYIDCLGDWDNELGVEVERAEQVIPLTQSLSKQFASRIRGIKVLPVFEQLKIMNFPQRSLATKSEAKGRRPSEGDARNPKKL